MRIVYDRRSKFAMTCVQCCNELIVPVWSVHRDERQIVHLWRCPKCESRFEVISPADTRSIEVVMRRIEEILKRRDVLRSRLVA
jgi:formate dehydrogenase maturation protein FdhE